MKLLIYVLLISSFIQSHAQIPITKMKRNAMAVIELEIKHSMRPSLNNIKVEINAFRKAIEVKVLSRPRDESDKWHNSYRDTVIVIKEEKFNKVLASIKKINISDISNSFNVIFSDGYSTKLTFGGIGNQITYEIRNPSRIGEKYHVPFYRETCELILELAGFSEEEIFTVL